MRKRFVDRTKPSNKKCEHCRFYSRTDWCCHKGKVALSIPYWKHRSCFEWSECVI